MIYTDIQKKLKEKKLFFLLIDPDKYNSESLKETINSANNYKVDIILVGGSIISNCIDETINQIKEYTNIPVILFPGNPLQITNKADGIFFLSLISGRNPEFLIGNHVIAAPKLRKINIDVIPVGYILIEGGKTTSVEYMSNTKPIPADKTDIVVATAIAGEMMGNKFIYLEAGSGAKISVHPELIKKVKENISVPLIVGGGIKTKEKINEIYNAGADIIVVGNAIESNPQLIENLTK